jgi:hypothetical protein
METNQKSSNCCTVEGRGPRQSLRLHVSPKHPLFAGLGAAVCEPLDGERGGRQPVMAEEPLQG